MKRKKLFKSKGLKETWAPLIMALFLPVSGFAVMPTIKKTQHNGIVSPLVNITGTIKDSNGQPLPGASVKIKGTTTGTSTDGSGVFRLNLPTGNETIVVSMMGYKTQEISMTGKTTITVTLIDEASDLDEVVVVGYGTVKKRDLTGSVASVKADDIVLTPTGNAMNALQGKVAGMDIMTTSGKAGSSPTIRLRGNHSASGSNDPLYIIDGIPGSYSDLNPNDIESIDVLKDASSAAIYGSAGSNGVVMITTKKGKVGSMNINFDSFFGYNGFPKYPHGLIGDDYIKLKREAYRGEKGNYPEFNSEIFINNAQQQAAYEAGKWVDWVDLAMRDGLQQNYNVSVNGATEKTATYLSLNYNDEQGLIKNDQNKKYGARANIDHTLSKLFKVGTNLQLTYTDNDAAAQNIFGNSLTFAPFGDPFDANGNINHVPIENVTNPLSDQIPNQYVNNTLNTYFAGNAYLEAKPFKGLTFRSVIGTVLGSSRTGRYFGTQSIANPVAGYKVPAAVIDNQRIVNYRWENILTYDFDLNDDHRFSLTGVTSMAKNRAESSSAGGSGFDLDSYSFHNLAAASSTIISSAFVQDQSTSFVGRMNYNYKGKYLLSVSNRWDGVSRLSVGHKWDSFPAAAAAWRISDEGFFKDIKSVTSLKLRVGYGITGNSGGVGAYGTQAGGYNAPRPVGFGDVAAPAFILNQLLANRDLGWEKSYNTNVGLDAEFFKGIVNLTVDWYNTDTKDMLFQRELPGSLGGSWGAPFKIWQNIGEMNNRGLEILINTRNIERDNFSWGTTFTFAANKEQITSLPGGKDLVSGNYFYGQPLKTYFNYKYLGIWQENEAAEAAKYNSVPGDIKLQTDGIFNGDGKHPYGPNDRVVLGSEVPDWTAGLQNNIKYKNFDASLMLTARWGQMISSNLITRYNPINGTTANSPDDVDYWTPENPGAYLPRPGIHSSTGGYIGFDALKFVDGSFFKIRNITLGYTLQEGILKKMSMKKLRFYATANNPFIFTKSDLLKYQDPESNGSDNFPLTKQFVLGLNVTF
ncbi:MAG: TonB-dependent receptor [Pedobacter sp.]|uniref:SusC/RagA family TonB-linked outer membrane protein n=1 Tax=Pedobacter sp. TaxID=1411316 RepID=UPI0035686C6D